MTNPAPTHTASIAPMMGYTDKHFRYLMRLLSKHLHLYTPMITTHAIIHGDRKHLLDFNHIEHPLALQLGGSDPQALSHCAQIAEERGYDEINLNIGCPSSRVQSGLFGACLMNNPELVADCVDHIRAKVTIPVTVKTRIGIDDHDSYDFLKHFITTISAAGCSMFIIHARKALLKGLSPKENRTVPPLNYARVYQLKREFPRLKIIINGGITTLPQAQHHLNQVDGIMLGRIAYKDPYLLAQIDRDLFNASTAIPTRRDIMHHYQHYMQQQIQLGVAARHLTQPIMRLYHGQPHARKYRYGLTMLSSRNDISPHRHSQLDWESSKNVFIPYL